MSDALSALQAAGDGAVVDLVTRMKNIATELSNVENLDSVEYKKGLYDELKTAAEVLATMGVAPSDVFGDDTESVPYEVVVQMYT